MVGECLERRVSLRFMTDTQAYLHILCHLQVGVRDQKLGNGMVLPLRCRLPSHIAVWCHLALLTILQIPVDVHGYSVVDCLHVGSYSLKDKWVRGTSAFLRGRARGRTIGWTTSRARATDFRHGIGSAISGRSLQPRPSTSKRFLPSDILRLFLRLE